MSKGKARVFVPLTKVDEEQRLVYGTITQQILDKSGEMMDYTSSKPNFEKWSNDIHEATGGLSKGNLRVMHGLNVAGKLTELDFNDNDQSIEVCSKIVDENEWQKVLEGCYTGFSVGGRYGKKWNETIDGSVIKKYEAIPNEVSLVDNPCCPSATFSLVKADGAEEDVMFKAAIDDVKPGEDAPNTGDTPPAVETPASTPGVKTPDPKSTPGEMGKTVTNEEVAARATELAKAVSDTAVWTDYIVAARDELTKGVETGLSLAAAQQKEAQAAEAAKTTPESHPDAIDPNAADNEAETQPVKEGTEVAADPDAPVEKVTPPGIKQRWLASDDTAFEKKSDCEAHEATLVKAAPVELTEAEALAARLSKALDPTGDEDEPELPLMEDMERLGKAVQALITPFGEDGKPALEKGMYVVNRFSNILSDMAAVAKKIKSEATVEGGDSADASVSADIMSAVKTLGASFITYAQDQVTELLAGMDDDIVVTVYDYYYDAAQIDPENGLAKDVTALITDLREPAKEKRETLVKAFGFIEGETLEGSDDTLSPPMQKRFDELTADNAALKKVAEDAVGQVEGLAKRMKAIEDTPQPRAPNGNAVALKEGDGTFLGKAATTEDERLAVLQDMLKIHGADGMATMMIKASQATGGHKLSLKS